MSFPNNEAEDRVIARALDQEDGDEAAMDRATVDEYRRVLAHLPFDEVVPPAALEDSVLAAALAVRPAAARSIERKPKAKRRATARWVTLGAAVAAAAAVVTFMFTTSNGGGGVEAEIKFTGTQVSEIVEQPGTREAQLLQDGVSSGPPIGNVALATDGKGVIYDLALEDAGVQPGQVVWVWLVVDDNDVLMGSITDPETQTAGIEVTGGDPGTVDGVLMTIGGRERPTEPGVPLARATFAP
jgi:hypothetical protein